MRGFVHGFDNRIIAQPCIAVAGAVDVGGDLQIDCFTVYELACRLQYVNSFYVPTLT